jgi:hypothetical protein
MATILTYNDGNILESVTKMVVNLSPTDTPVISNAGKTKAVNTLHQWPEDSLATRGSNAIVEGTTISYGTRTAPSRVTNYTQFMVANYSVSSSEIAAKGAGIDNQFVYQKAKALKELSNDMEWNYINATVSAGTATAARQMGGLRQKISTNSTASWGAPTPKLTETAFILALQQVWAAGGNPDLCFAPSYMKRAITGFVANETRYIMASEKKLVNNIAVYESPFGIVEIALSRDIPNAESTAGFIVVDSSKYSMAILDPVTVKDPSEVSQNIYGTQGYASFEGTLELNEKACAKMEGFSIAGY